MFSFGGLRRSSKVGVPELDAKYKVLSDIGKGSFAIVKKIRNRQTNVEYALKIIDKKKAGTTTAMIDTELTILKAVHHPHIVCLIDFYETDESLYLVMEYCAGGELFDKIVEKGYYSEREASAIIRQIVSALEYLHKHHIVHRDMKPENVLLTTKNDLSINPMTDGHGPSNLALVKLTDFGLSRIMPSTTSTLQTACGTPGYVAPEVLLREGYDAAVDMWSVGVLMYILLCGYPPFYHEDQKTLLRQIVKGNFAFHEPYWQNISNNAKDCINKLLVVKPSERLNAEQCLRHPWVRGLDVPTVDLFPSIQTALKKEISRRKFRSAVEAVKLIQRLGKSKKRMDSENCSIQDTSAVT